MEVDVDQQLQFPEAIFISTRSADIVIYSLKLRKVILIKLTCPAEENIEEWHSEKISRYDGLLKDCINPGWKVHDRSWCMWVYSLLAQIMFVKTKIYSKNS